jgi:hypothetical protein
VGRGGAGGADRGGVTGLIGPPKASLPRRRGWRRARGLVLPPPHPDQVQPLGKPLPHHRVEHRVQRRRRSGGVGPRVPRRRRRRHGRQEGGHEPGARQAGDVARHHRAAREAREPHRQRDVPPHPRPAPERRPAHLPARRPLVHPEQQHLPADAAPGQDPERRAHRAAGVRGDHAAAAPEPDARDHPLAERRRLADGDADRARAEPGEGQPQHLRVARVQAGEEHGAAGAPRV